MPTEEPVRGSARVHGDGRVDVMLQFQTPATVPPPGSRGLATATESCGAVAGEDRPSHTRGFASARWRGVQYAFSPTQRLVVAALWGAWQDGTRWMMQEALLEQAESDGCRLRDLFRGHPAWGTMIVPAVNYGGPPGSYRLAPLPGEEE
jgi:hypothetical protein